MLYSIAKTEQTGAVVGHRITRNQQEICCKSLLNSCAPLRARVVGLEDQFAGDVIAPEREQPRGGGHLRAVVVPIASGGAARELGYARHISGGARRCIVQRGIIRIVPMYNGEISLGSRNCGLLTAELGHPSLHCRPRAASAPFRGDYQQALNPSRQLVEREGFADHVGIGRQRRNRITGDK